MKQLFMILILLSGFAISEAAGQSCKPADCVPCPPGCCIINCCTSKGAAASVKAGQTTDVMFVSLMPENLNADPKAGKMSRKEMKACMAACKSSSASTDANCKPAPGCQPATACKSTTATAEASPVVHKLNLQKS